MRKSRTSLLPKLLLSLGLLLAAYVGQAQVYIMSNDNVLSCNGLFYDSGGSAGNYGDSESFVYTICPGNPGDVISIAFNSFALAGVDELFIFDGDNIGAPLLASGTGGSLAGTVQTASQNSPTGCLTFQFISDGFGNAAGWEAQVTCSTPCDRPTAVASSAPAAPARVCVGDMISFDGSASFAAPGFVIDDYSWDMGDGTFLSGAQVNHSYSAPGEYIVNLNLLDNIGCASTNPVDLVIWVGTEPEFGGTTLSPTACLGETVCLDGVVTGTEWNGIPPNLVAGTTALPDGSGVSYTTTIPVSGFSPGSSVGSALDIEEICITMEHSYLGDLDVYLECPNGQQVLLFDGYNGGGGNTYLGDPIDNNTGTPGMGWTYCFSEIGNFGTLLDEDGLGNHQQSTLTPGNSMIPGNYTVEGSYSSFVGCDLNGGWSLIITDNLGIDDGFIFDWSITFAPSLYPSITTFTPVYGAGCDSTSWSGPGIVNNSADCNNTCVLPGSVGTFDYVYTATDNFGCTYDTTIQVTITPGPEVDAGPDQVICNDSLQLDATVLNVPPPPPPCDYTLELYDSFGDGWDGASVDIFINGVSTNYTFSSGSQADFIITVNDGDVIDINYNSGSFESEHTYTFFDPNGNGIFSDGPNPTTGIVFNTIADCGPSAPNYVYSWSPATGLSATDILDPMVYTNSTTMYYITIWEDGHPDCAHTDSVMIMVDPGLNPGTDTAIVVCANQPSFNLIDMMGGNPDPGGDWTDSNGNPFPPTFDPLVDPSQELTYTVTSVNGCIGSALLDIEVLPLGDPLCCAEPDAGSGGISCNLSFTLGATPANGNFGVWSGPPGSTFTDASDPAATITVASGGTFWIYWIEDNQPICYVVDSVEVTFTDEFDPVVSTTDAICFDACDGEAFVTPTGGNAPFTYNWSGGIAGLADDTAFAVCAGSYTVTLTDVNNCTDDTSFVISEPAPMEIDAINTIDETCYGECDGQVEVIAPDAVQYSFDGGNTFGAAGTMVNQCVGNYNVVVANADGCLALGAASVSGPPPVEASFSWSPQPALLSNPVVSFFNGSNGANTFVWDFAGLDSSTTYQTAFEFPNDIPNVYEVCLAAANTNGCADTICNLVEVEDELAVFVPNAFTPNGDGKNDWFQASFSIPVINYEMYIFDRWGGIVFESTDPNEPWYGTHRNELDIDKAVHDGVYAWRLKVQDPLTGLKQELVGHVTVIR